MTKTKFNLIDKEFFYPVPIIKEYPKDKKTLKILNKLEHKIDGYICYISDIKITKNNKVQVKYMPINYAKE